MTAQDLKRQIAARSLLPLYYLYGAEDYLVERMTRALSAAALDGGDASFNLLVVWASDKPEKAAVPIIETAQAFPFLAARRVVIVRDAEKLPLSPPLLAYLRQPSPETVLIFAEAPPSTGQKARSRKKRAESSVMAFLQSEQNGCGRDVTVEFRPLRDTALAAWIGQECEANGRSIDPPATSLLLELTGSSLRALASNIQKLVTAYPDSDVITRDIVREQLASTRVGDVFELGDLLLRRRPAEAQELAARLLETGDAVPIVASLAKTITTLWQLRVMPEAIAASARAAEGASWGPATVSDDTARKLGYFAGWQLKEFVANIHHFADEAYFTRCFEHLLEADLLLKSRSTTDSRAVIAALIHRLTAPAA